MLRSGKNLSLVSLFSWMIAGPQNIFVHFVYIFSNMMFGVKIMLRAVVDTWHTHFSFTNILLANN